jgi:hypothetical protein
LGTLAVINGCGNSGEPKPYVSYRVVEGSVPGPFLVDDSTITGSVFVVDDNNQSVARAFVRLRTTLGIVLPADTNVAADAPGLPPAFAYTWSFRRSQMQIDTAYYVRGCASNTTNRCDDADYVALTGYSIADTNPTVAITNNYSLPITFGWQQLTSGGSDDIPGVPRDTIPPGVARCEKLRARPDSAIFFAYTNLNSLISDPFSPHNHQYWVVVATAGGDVVVTYASNTPGC